MGNDYCPYVNDEVVARAVGRALIALRDPGASQRLSDYYDRASNYAGSTFAGLKPQSSTEITATDLIAVTTLSVDIPVIAVRRLLEDEELRSSIRTAMQALPACSLEETQEEDFAAMANFYDLIKGTLAKANSSSSNPWVTASKLSARKRPDLFPVRDRVVCKYLEIEKQGDRAKDWVVFRALMKHGRIREELERVTVCASSRRADEDVVIDTDPLRILDAVLWMHAPSLRG